MRGILGLGLLLALGQASEVWDRDIAPLGITRGQNAM